MDVLAGVGRCRRRRHKHEQAPEDVKDNEGHGDGRVNAEASARGVHRKQLPADIAGLTRRYDLHILRLGKEVFTAARQSSGHCRREGHECVVRVYVKQVVVAFRTTAITSIARSKLACERWLPSLPPLTLLLLLGWLLLLLPRLMEREQRCIQTANILQVASHL